MAVAHRAQHDNHPFPIVGWSDADSVTDSDTDTDARRFYDRGADYRDVRYTATGAHTDTDTDTVVDSDDPDDTDDVSNAQGDRYNHDSGHESDYDNNNHNNNNNNNGGGQDDDEIPSDSMSHSDSDRDSMSVSDSDSDSDGGGMRMSRAIRHKDIRHRIIRQRAPIVFHRHGGSRHTPCQRACDAHKGRGPQPKETVKVRVPLAWIKMAIEADSVEAFCEAEARHLPFQPAVCLREALFRDAWSVAHHMAHRLADRRAIDRESLKAIRGGGLADVDLLARLSHATGTQPSARWFQRGTVVALVGRGGGNECCAYGWLWPYRRCASLYYMNLLTCAVCVWPVTAVAALGVGAFTALAIGEPEWEPKLLGHLMACLDDHCANRRPLGPPLEAATTAETDSHGDEWRDPSKRKRVHGVDPFVPTGGTDVPRPYGGGRRHDHDDALVEWLSRIDLWACSVCLLDAAIERGGLGRILRVLRWLARLATHVDKACTQQPQQPSGGDETRVCRETRAGEPEIWTPCGVDLPALPDGVAYMRDAPHTIDVAMFRPDTSLPQRQFSPWWAAAPTPAPFGCDPAESAYCCAKDGHPSRDPTAQPPLLFTYAEATPHVWRRWCPVRPLAHALVARIKEAAGRTHETIGRRTHALCILSTLDWMQRVGLVCHKAPAFTTQATDQSTPDESAASEATRKRRKRRRRAAPRPAEP